MYIHIYTWLGTLFIACWKRVQSLSKSVVVLVYRLLWTTAARRPFKIGVWQSISLSVLGSACPHRPFKKNVSISPIPCKDETHLTSYIYHAKPRKHSMILSLSVPGRSDSIIIIIKEIYRAQNRPKATNALSAVKIVNCLNVNCLRITVKRKCLQLCSKSVDRNIGWLQRCR